MPQLGIDRKACHVIWVGDLEWAARRAIANLNTPEYQGAHAALEAAELRIEDLHSTETDIEHEIADTPPQTLAGVLIKLRLTVYWIRAEHSDSEGTLDEAALRTEERLALSALVDIERLARED